MKTAMKRVASLLLALIMILEVVAPGIVEARSANQNRATVSDDVFIPPDGNRIDPDQNAGSHLPNFIDPDDDGYYTPPQTAPARPAPNAPAQAAPQQGNEATDAEVSEEKVPAPLIEDEAKSKEMALEFSREKELAMAKSPQEGGIENKKFTIRTRFDTSTVIGPVKAGQKFTLHLDDRLTVNDPTTLKRLSHNGKILTLPPVYDKDKNTITYTIKDDIHENIKVPMAVDVDYNTANIDPNAEKFTIINSVTGIGVTDPKDLIPVVVDKNGNLLSSIIEPGRDDVIKVIEEGDNYRVNVDAFGDPMIKDGKLDQIRWTVKITSDTDLKALGLKTNFTTVEGSGLGSIDDLSATNLNEPKKGVEENSGIINELGIVSSMHHNLSEPTKEVYYTFYTKVTNIQASYMLDLSAVLTNKPTENAATPVIGAVRLVLPQGYSQDQIREATPTRVGMNNRTTVKGEFTSTKQAAWTVTDAVSSKDPGALPLEDRKLEGAQNNPNGSMAVYGIGADGKMVVKTIKKGMNEFPKQGTDPTGEQAVGTIAVYKLNTTLGDTEKARYTVSGVSISKYEDLYIKQVWGDMPDDIPIPKQYFIVKNKKTGDEIFKTEPEVEGLDSIIDGKRVTSRRVTLAGVKYWDIDDNGEATRLDHKIEQEWADDTKTVKGNVYDYYEVSNYYRPDDKFHFIQNRAVRDTGETPGTFAVVKVDSKDAKKLPGATFKLSSFNVDAKPGDNVEAITGSDGKITFSNIAPGYYSLKETKAPAGYKIDPESKTVTVAQDGGISVNGSNASFSSGGNQTQYVKNDHDSYWPDYMNTMHYGKIDESGNLTFYLYLKPYAAKSGSTDRNTRLAISSPDFKVTDVAVYDVDPNTKRDTIREAMQSQSLDDAKIKSLGDNVIGASHDEGKVITGEANKLEETTGRTGYRLYFPKERFRNDWGFLVKVTANIGAEKTSVPLYYDWLTNEDTANQTKLQHLTTIYKGTADSTPTITIANEAFKKEPVSVTKVDKDKKPLPGATFVLKDEYDQPITHVEVNAEGEAAGKADFGELPPGKYILEETEAPEGYITSPVVFDVTVAEDGEVTYTPRFKTGSGEPVQGTDYYMVDEESEPSVGASGYKVIENKLEYKENEPGNIGRRDKVWEAYCYESLKYTAKIEIPGAAAGSGSRFSIQFDPNLDFKQYVSDMPKIKNDKGIVIADPYFDYSTNRLTYVFNNNAKNIGTTASVHIRGIIPSKYYAKADGTYPFTIKVLADVKNENIVEGKNLQSQTTKIVADYDRYDTDSGTPAQAYYFRDVYTGADGEEYFTVFAYYNPLKDKHRGPRTLSFNWLSTNFGGNNKNIIDWPANGSEPAFDLQNVKIYRTPPDVYRIGDKPLNRNMPISFGIRPEQDTNTYTLVYEKAIDPKRDAWDSTNGFTLKYDPEQIQTWGTLRQNSPLTIAMPGISRNDEGYVIEQTFKVTDKDNWFNLFRTFYMSNGTLKSAFASKVNQNRAIADQTGQEIPKFYTQKVMLVNRKYTPGEFSIVKYNEANSKETLAGATFALTNEKGQTIHRTTGKDGTLGFEKLPPGNYTLEETNAPEGYKKSDKKWHVYVSNTGKVTITELGLGASGDSFVGDNEKPLTMRVSNKPVGTEFVVYKKNGKGEPLAGAEFTITDSKDVTKTETRISDSDGHVNFEKLDDGTYILAETKPPKGYKSLNKKWVVVVKSGKAKVYNYVEGTDTGSDIVTESLLAGEGTHWVDVAQRPLTGWNLDDSRLGSWVNNWPEPYKMGTRIIGINKDNNYVIQRYIINPEGSHIDEAKVQIHREKLTYENMDWYNGDEEYKVYKLTKEPVTGTVEDFRLSEYGAKEINNVVDFTTGATQQGDETHDRQAFNFKNIDTPIVIDVKVPYKEESGGVGTGMDLWIDNQVYVKSDYYERVSDIVVGEEVRTDDDSAIIGSYVSEGSLDVANEPEKYSFKLKKVKETDATKTIQGAKFSLKGPDGSNETRTYTTGADGIIAFDELTPGAYTLTEEKAPPGYEKQTTTWTVTVTEEGEIYIKDATSTGPADADKTVSIDKTASVAGQMSRSASLNNFLAPFGEEAAPVSTEAPAAEEAADAKESVKAQEASAEAKPSADAAQAPNAQVEEAKDAANAGHAAKAENSDASQVSAPLNDQISATKQLNNFLTTFGANSGLELGEENVPSPVRAVGWETIDPRRSEAPDTRANPNNPVQVSTKITDINKDTHKFKQVFLIDGSKNKDTNFALNLHRQPIGTLNKDEIAVKVYAVANGSTVDNLMSKKPISIKAVGPDNYNDTQVRVNFTGKPQAQLFAIEVESTYTPESPVGLGMDYFYKVGGHPTTWPKYWGASSYNSEDDINCKYDVVINQSQYGTVTSKQGNLVKQGTAVELDVQPDSGYELDSISVKDATGNEIANSATFTMPASNVTVTASFKKQEALYNVTFDPMTNGKVTAEPTQAKAGDSVTLTVAPNDGYELSELKVNGKTVQVQGNTYTFTMPASDVSVTASFIEKVTLYNVTVDPTTNGSVTPDRTQAKAGDPVKLTVAPNDGYELSELKVNGSPVQVQGNTYTFTMPASNVTVAASFAPVSTEEFTILSVTADPTAGGTASADPMTVKSGGVVKLTATPYEGYQLKEFVFTDESGNPIQIEILDKDPGAAQQTRSARMAPVAKAPAATAQKQVTKYIRMPAKDVNIVAKFEYLGKPVGKDDFAVIKNKQTGLDLKVFKKTFYGKPLKDAEFTLKKMTDETYETIDNNFGVNGKYKVRSDENGLLTVLNEQGEKKNPQPTFGEGYYLLTEDVAPDGYKKITAPWKIHVREQDGKLVADYYGPQETSTSFVVGETAKVGLSSTKDGDFKVVDPTTNTTSGIKIASRTIFMDPEAKIYRQRVYIDTRERSDTINVQINPVIKRDEKDTPGASPETLKGGVKTAYRTTYAIDMDVADPKLTVDDVLKSYDLSKPGVSMVNTARWRPFDWGFDEDQLNLEPGVYFVDVEGYYDDNIVKEGNIDIKFEFFSGERTFREATRIENGHVKYKGRDKVTLHDSYQNGDAKIAESLGNYGETWKNKLSKEGKYQNWLGKLGGRIYPAVDPDDYKDVDNSYKPPIETQYTRIDISPLYTSEEAMPIPEESGMIITNEEESYNITFSKHGRDGEGEEWNPVGDKVAKNRLEGAVFKLQQEVNNSFVDLPGTFVASAFNGYFGFRGLKPGRYRLMEVTAPQGYVPIKAPILYFSIAYNKEDIEIIDEKTGKSTIIPGKTGYISVEHDVNSNDIYKYVDADGKQVGVGLVDYVTAATAKNMGKVVNEKPGKGNVTITKVDEKGQVLKYDEKEKPIPGAEFKLTRVSADNPDATINIKTGQIEPDGTYTFENLPIGNYRLEETKAQAGHMRTDMVWNFTVGGKDLDPYADDKNTPQNDVTDRITLGDTTVNVQKYMDDDETNEKDTVYPHKAQSISIQSKYKVDLSQPRINPGDYFTVKLSDAIDMNGIYKHRVMGPNGEEIEQSPSELNIFADGVGTIAKGTYDKKNNEITFVFTDYAKLYSLDEFKTHLVTYIDLDKIKTSNTKDGVPVGVKVGSIEKTQNLKVNYDFENEISSFPDYAQFGYNYNLIGKIFELDPETGDFVQYYYLNPLRRNGYNMPWLHFKANQTLDWATITIEKLKKNDPESLKTSMPESFGLPKTDDNREKPLITWTYNDVREIVSPALPMSSNDSYIVTIRGKLNPKFASGLYTTGTLREQVGWTRNYYTGRWDPHIVGPVRNDWAYFDESTAEASANLSIRAMNPRNKIEFKKTDINGSPLTGAKFYLYKEGKDEAGKPSWSVYRDITTAQDGLITFDTLPTGKYYVVEEKAAVDQEASKGKTAEEIKELPEKFVRIPDHIMELTVDKRGRIYKTVDGEQKEEINGDNPIRVVNHKPIKLEKRDGRDTDTFLPGAEFDVYYKEKEDGKYEPYKIKDPKNPDGEKITYHVAVGKDGELKGKVSLKLYKAGYYALKETVVPEGYTKPPMEFVKEFRLEDDRFSVKEKGFEGNVKKQDGATDKDTSFILAEKTNGGFYAYYVINPSHDKRRYDKKSNAQLRFKDLDVRKVDVIVIGKKGGNSQNGSAHISYSDPDGYPTLDLYSFLGGGPIVDWKDIFSESTIILKVQLAPKTADQTKVAMDTVYTDQSTTAEASYEFNPSTLPDYNANWPFYLEHPEGPNPFDPKYKGEEGQALLKKDEAKYKSGLETYLEPYRKEFFVKYESEDKPVEVLNYKGTYPLTGGFGPNRWIVIIGAVIAAVAAEEYIRRKRTSAPKGGA